MAAVEHLDIASLLETYRQSGRGEFAHTSRAMMSLRIHDHGTASFAWRRIAAQVADRLSWVDLSATRSTHASSTHDPAPRRPVEPRPAASPCVP